MQTSALPLGYVAFDHLVRELYTKVSGFDKGKPMEIVFLVVCRCIGMLSKILMKIVILLRHGRYNKPLYRIIEKSLRSCRLESGINFRMFVCSNLHLYTVLLLLSV